MIVYDIGGRDTCGACATCAEAWLGVPAPLGCGLACCRQNCCSFSYAGLLTLGLFAGLFGGRVFTLYPGVIAGWRVPIAASCVGGGSSISFTDSSWIASKSFLNLVQNQYNACAT